MNYIKEYINDLKGKFGFKIGDLILILFISVLALILFLAPFLKKEASFAEIVLAKTGEVKTVSLATDAVYEITSSNVHLTVSVEDGKIFVSRSDCRDSICKNTPPISKAGQSIVCAPAGVVVRITGEEGVDGVSR